MNNKIKTALDVATQEFPSLRFGQLIHNAIPKDKLYSITDEEFVKAIWAYIKEHGK